MIKRILLSLPLWLGYTVLELALQIIGLPLIAVLALCGAYKWRPSKVWPAGYNDRTEVSAWDGGWLTWLWGNEEDGVTGPTWWSFRNIGRPHWQSDFHWSALRNPVNNLRFVPGINPVIDPARVRHIRHTWWHNANEITLTWQGPFAGLQIMLTFLGSSWHFWWGWKLKPQDIAGVLDTDMRKPRCGFATQLQRIS